MVNPGAFGGSRKQFLTGEKENYSVGVTEGYASDALALIQRRYFKRFPIELAHNEEPSPEFNARIDDDGYDPEQEAPDMESLGPVAYEEAIVRLEARGKEVAFRKAQIQRWLAYQYMKDHDMDPKESGAHNPYRFLLHKLAGTTIQRPRLKSPVNVWRKTIREAIEQELRCRTLTGTVDHLRVATTRDAIARSMFAALSDVEKDQWKIQAAEEHQALVEEWQANMDSEPSTLPQDRQRCIQGIVRFAQPFLDLLCSATGWKATLIAGGPKPAHEGRLNVISVHSGTTSGDVGLTFGRLDRVRYKKLIVPFYGQFLQKCYGPEECRKRALVSSEGFENMLSMDPEADDTVNFDSFGFAEHATSSVLPPGTNRNTEQPHASASAPQVHINTRRVPASVPNAPRAARSPSLSLSLPPSPRSSPAPSPRSSPAPSPRSSPAPSPGISATPPLTDSPRRESIPNTVAETSGRLTAPRRGNKRKRGDIPPSHELLPAAKLPHCTLQPSLPAAPSRLDGRITRSTKKPSQPSMTSSTPITKAISTAVPVGTAPPLTIQTYAPGAPQWFIKALSMFQQDSEKLGGSWARLVRGWVSFEETAGYNEVASLPASLRPGIVTSWIKRARAPTWRPPIADLHGHDTEHQRWWDSLQPEWRVDGNGKRVVDPGGSWDCLRRPGRNSLLSVMASLFHWGIYVHQDGRDVALWSHAVEDCLFVFSQLAAPAV